ncbi:MAG TPA: 4-hydroxybenzoate octaprenyltransferase [Alphaproteobacteria bacterium]|nr:4-hydroxybenzoate octaprenyltransferase [Alphaproteobacteria bacterium]
MSEKAAGFTDIRSGGWIDRLAPVWLRPFLKLARLDRPIGTWLLLFPCWWGLALASRGWPDPALAIAFAVGAVVMRGAGCTYNDMVDREFDARVERTRGRPLPSGAISLRGAAVFLALQLLAGLAILFTFNTITIALGIASLALVFTYPFMKRVTWWPQAFLGLTFNWGVLMGWSAVTGDITLPALLLYTGAIAWTIGYDTIYAHQDKEDDALIGLRSTALLFGAASGRWITSFYVLALVLFAAAGVAANLAWPYWIALAVASLQLGWQVHVLKLDDPADCLMHFRSNRWVGWILLAGIVAGRLFAA